MISLELQAFYDFCLSQSLSVCGGDDGACDAYLKFGHVFVMSSVCVTYNVSVSLCCWNLSDAADLSCLNVSFFDADAL
jgi:hypothetical protein